MTVARLQLSIRSQELLRHLLEALVKFAPEQLLDGAFRSWDAGSSNATERAHLVVLHDLDLGVALRQLLPDQRILCSSMTIAAARKRQLDQPLHIASVGDLQACAKSSALVHQSAHGHIPAFINLAHHVFGRNLYVMEKEFVEL